jgi:hypothetical protein
LKLKAHDCFGSVFQIEGAEVKFLCAFCHLPFNVLSAEGLRTLSKHGGGKHPNAIPIEALEVAIAYVRKVKERDN